MAQLNFDARSVKPDEGRQPPIPAAYYNMALTSSEMKPVANSQTGAAFLACEFSVLDGQYQGRKVFFNFNLRNDNPKTVEIAYGQLSALCHATGFLTIGDSVELHNKPFKARVKIRPATMENVNGVMVEKYEATNDITAFKSINDPSAVNAPSGATTGPANPAFAQPPASFQPPAQQQAQPAFAQPQGPGAWSPPAGAPQQQPQQQAWQPPAQPQAWAAPAGAQQQPQQQAQLQQQQAAAQPPAWGAPA